MGRMEIKIDHEGAVAFGDGGDKENVLLFF